MSAPRENEIGFKLKLNAQLCQHRLSLCGQTLAAKPFSDPAWLFEPKWDGWRTLCFVRDGKVHLVSRRKNSLNERFPELREIGKAVKAKAALIDGEIVALGEDGLPQFDALRLKRARKYSIVFYASHLLH